MYKKLIIHDLGEQWTSDPPADTLVVNTTGVRQACTGCFGCWLKNPGACVIKDDFQKIPAYAGKCEELILISECLYGGFSLPVKNALDRFIGYMLPYFTIRGDNQMHHVSRYKHQFQLSVHFYGSDLTPAEKQTAEKLVERNGLNFNSKTHHVQFYDTIDDLGGIHYESCNYRRQS